MSSVLAHRGLKANELDAASWCLLPLLLVNVGLIGALLAGVHPIPLFSDGVHKLLFFGGIILVVGNISVTPLWVFALGLKPFREHPIQRQIWVTIAWADVLFTAPGEMLALTGALFAAPRHFDAIPARWKYVAISSLLLSNMAWMLILVPSQRRMLRLLDNGAEPTDPRCFLASRRWWIFGAVANATTYLVLAIVLFYW